MNLPVSPNLSAIYDNLSLIAAVAQNHVIGINNQLPWDLPQDLRFFKAKTSGHPIIMGRKTFDSIGKPLPNRRNIVLTRQANWQHPGCETYPSLQAALIACRNANEIFVIGGAEVYRQALPYARKLYLTEVQLEIDGDAFFPTIPPTFTETWRESHPTSTQNELAFDFVVYQRQ